MKHCTQCGHVLGLGRFCTNCGHPVAARMADPLTDPLEPEAPSAPEPPATVATPEADADWRTDTAERVPRSPSPGAAGVPPTAAPRVPPAAGEPPPPPRFPLFADEVAEQPAAVQAASAPAAATLASWEQEDEDLEDEDWDDWEDDSRRRTVWVVAAVLVLVALVAGAWFLGQALGDGDDDRAEDPTGGGGSETAQEPVDHTAEAAAEAPETAPPNEDVDGNPTSYDASNMLDGVPETAWRAAGDGSGFKLVFTFPEQTRISQVGLINGYAKEANDASGAPVDWYAGHRRIEQVTWNFGVGDVVRQDLVDDRGMQTIDVEPVEVRKIVLKIVSTTPPGEGPTGRNYTAVSDVFLAG